MLVAGATLSADLAATAVKHAVGRKRPYVTEPEPPPLLDTPLDLSLPSGHGATSFAGALVLAVAIRRVVPAVLLFALAAGIAWSRVYVGVHYPSDLVLGALLGLAVGGAALALASWLRSPRRPGADPPRSPQARPRG